VAYDSRYGNTEKIAKSLQKGLEESGLETHCLKIGQALVKSLQEFDLIAVGGPTQEFTASKSMKDFLHELNGADLGGKGGFAFDTRFDVPLSGHAAKAIEKQLKNSGIGIISQHASAIVLGGHKEEEGGVKLKDGEEKRFEEIGKTIGAIFSGNMPRKEEIII
jgi:flavodoxin